ncbi:MAG: MFS transporter [Deltaproteobacteria bacterium]|nr:MFS transporter [Deltaproteobacteria bacterium]
MADRVPFVDAGFTDHVRALARPRELRRAEDPLREGSRLTCGQALAIFRSQVESRHVDLGARNLKKGGLAFYTIGSSGHEGNAAVAAALRPSDPALLHYRSGAFFLERARQLGRDDGMYAMLLGIVASSDEPIAGGRHKVFGHAEMAIPPQTSTIASHLPKAVGMAFGLGRAARLGLATSCPSDALIAVSFGDASVNHSTAQGALNAAAWAAHQGQAVPVLFVCEDNGIGISVPTPEGWVRAGNGARAGIEYLAVDGLDLDATYGAAEALASYVRRERRPAFLHVRTVRLMGHAGSDIETVYRTLDAIEDTEALDPLRVGATLLVESGAATPEQLLEIYESARARVADLGRLASTRPKLTSATEVMRPIAPRDDAAIAKAAAALAAEPERRHFWGDKLPEELRPAGFAQHVNWALGDLLAGNPKLFVFGEDVAKKGGVYGVTRELSRRARRGRVFDTLLDEQTILGLAIGFGQLGLLPAPEIQYLAYLHNAEDQLRGEASSLQFFSNGQFQNPMVVRIAGYGYQKGFGGHFHNDNSVAVLRDIPGVVIASPARGDDAAALLRTCVAAAKTAGSVCVFLEPIALYGERDLHDKGDGAWAAPYEPASESAHAPIGKGRLWRDGEHLTLVSWANGLWMSLRVAERLEREHGVRCRVFDLRWLAPLPIDELHEHASHTGKVLVVDETRRTGGVSEGILTALVDRGFVGKMRRVTSEDCFIPLGDAANLVLLQEQTIQSAALELARS